MLVRIHGITFKNNNTQESTRWITWTRNYWDITNVDLKEPGRFTHHCCSWLIWKWIETGALNTVPDMSPIKFLAPDCMLKLFADDCDWEVIKQFCGSGALIATLSTSSSLTLLGIALMLSGSTDFLFLSEYCTVLWPLSWRISLESTPFWNNWVHMDLQIEWFTSQSSPPCDSKHFWSCTIYSHRLWHEPFRLRWWPVVTDTLQKVIAVEIPLFGI